MAYAQEADILNVALFGFTAKTWREANPDFAKTHNVRDFALYQLAVLNEAEKVKALP